MQLYKRHMSLENLNPHAACDTRKSSDWIATINLVATTCGGGVLSLPLVFSRAGILPVTFFMMVGAMITEFSLYLLIVCARRTGARTYGGVAEAAFGRLANVVTTITLVIMLFGTLIAYQVLMRDIWSGVIFAIVPTRLQHLLTGHWSIVEDQEVNQRQAANVLLSIILLLAFPLLLQKDLHALRHTCYLGFSSCVLLAIAVTYRAFGRHIHSGTTNIMDVSASHSQPSLLWYSTDVADLLFAVPIVVLCFFCSYNALSIHSQLVNPTRKRVRKVLDRSMLLCFVLFYLVGLCGYLYAGTETFDNILLNFPVEDPAIFAGRCGYCFTLLFGLPLMILPCREAMLSIVKPLRTSRRDSKHNVFELDAESQRCGAHLMVNEDDLDALEPYHVLKAAAAASDSCALQGSTAHIGNYGTSGSHVNDDITELTTLLSHCASEDNSDVASYQESLVAVNTKAGWSDDALLSWGIQLGLTLAIVSVTYTASILIPGVAAVWSIFGSSMAIWIAFIVPFGCYLRIRERKGMTLQAAGASILLIISSIAAVFCTRQAVSSALAGD